MLSSPICDTVLSKFLLHPLVVFVLLCSLFFLCAPVAIAQAPRTLGLLDFDERGDAGYTLVAPLRSTQTYLLDPRGFVVKQWSSAYFPGQYATLLDDGRLLRLGTLRKKGILRFDSAAGVGGHFQIFAWDNTLLWNWRFCDSLHVAHHGIDVLPNGNLLVIAWELVTRDSALAWGRDPAKLVENELWVDMILEIEPLPPSDARIVWEWRLKDHLIQDFDSTKRFYGDVGAHPGRLDFNYFCDLQFKPGGENDWNHANAVDWNPSGDLVMLDLRHQAELLILDHSTTSEEARSDSGGRSGRGGEILYRWGNPASHRAGEPEDRQLFGQHDAHWIPDSLPGGGNVLVFDNGRGSPYSPWRSRVLEVAIPAPARILSGEAWRKEATIVWTYEPTGAEELYSAYVSTARRQTNGNTLVCSGWEGLITEVTPEGEAVWRYVIPENNHGRNLQGRYIRNNQVFSAQRYSANHPGLAARSLPPAGTLERYAGSAEAGAALLNCDSASWCWRNPFTAELELHLAPADAESDFQLLNHLGVEIGELTAVSRDVTYLSPPVLPREFCFLFRK